MCKKIMIVWLTALIVGLAIGAYISKTASPEENHYARIFPKMLRDRVDSQT